MPVALGETWSPLQHPDTPSGGIDLLQGAFASSSLARDWWPALRLPLILAGLLLLLQVGATTTEWVLLKREKQHLQTAMEQHFRTAFPDARVVVDAPLQMQRNLAELRGASRQLTPGDFLPLLARTATALDADSRNRLRAVHYDSGQLRLEVALPDRAAADALQARLNDAGLDSRLDDVSGTRAAVAGAHHHHGEYAMKALLIQFWRTRAPRERLVLGGGSALLVLALGLRLRLAADAARRGADAQGACRSCACRPGSCSRMRRKSRSCGRSPRCRGRTSSLTRRRRADALSPAACASAIESITAAGRRPCPGGVAAGGVRRVGRLARRVADERRRAGGIDPHRGDRHRRHGQVDAVLAGGRMADRDAFRLRAAALWLAALVYLALLLAWAPASLLAWALPHFTHAGGVARSAEGSVWRGQAAGIRVQVAASARCCNWARCAGSCGRSISSPAVSATGCS